MTETLQVIEGKSVTSSLGWRLDLLSGDAVQYTEAQRSLKIKIEDRARVTGELEWILYTPESWIWTVGDRREPVGPERIAEILNRIDQAFWKLDMPIKRIV